MGPRRFVDYEDSAGDYARHRAGSAARLDTWTEQVAPYLRDVGGVAIDLGSGAGAFSSALRHWGARYVVAVEPSSAMQSSAPVARGVFKVSGRAVAIPLRSDSSTFVWISTAFHHFDDPPRAVRECRRVLAPQGRVIVRGFIPGHTHLEWLTLFPGSEKAIARFPDLHAMTARFSDAGFRMIQASLVEEGSQTYGARAEFSSAMRRADSILTAMTDAEVDAGIAALRHRHDEIERFAMSCLIFEKN